MCDCCHNNNTTEADGQVSYSRLNACMFVRELDSEVLFEVIDAIQFHSQMVYHVFFLALISFSSFIHGPQLVYSLLLFSGM